PVLPAPSFCFLSADGPRDLGRRLLYLPLPREIVGMGGHHSVVRCRYLGIVYAASALCADLAGPGGAIGNAASLLPAHPAALRVIGAPSALFTASGPAFCLR